MSHTFHIPVLGLAYSVDTPLKVAKYGISSVVSIVDDELVERMRELHTPKTQEFVRITKSQIDFRARRITMYLNLLDDLVNKQFAKIKDEAFLPGSDITRYFELLPAGSPKNLMYEEMLYEKNPQRKSHLQNRLRMLMVKGNIDVNIMAKVDKINYLKNGEADPAQLSDALSALKGFADSKLRSSLTLSAGMNPRLYGYLEEFADFYPGPDGSQPVKKIILKVSDFRSAFIQAKFLAKKGIWIHEFRIESGLNCGGHAFATEGFLLGPILEEFKQKRNEMRAELFEIYRQALTTKNIEVSDLPVTRVTVQGGIGTADEDTFLKQHYQLDGTGWGSPFLLVPEATNVDTDTLNDLAAAGEDDFYISDSSPLGIPFNNFRYSTGEIQRLQRIAKGVPGSPCTKKYLVSNTEFTTEPICTASREYQNLKIKQLNTLNLSAGEYTRQFNEITEKICLCEGLCASAYIKNNMLKPRENRAVTICPGPNTAFFKGIYSLDEMVKHIYGKTNLLQNISRPNVFVNELKLYVTYLRKEADAHLKEFSDKKAKQLEKFKSELDRGIEYYSALVPSLVERGKSIGNSMQEELTDLKSMIDRISLQKTSEIVR